MASPSQPLFQGLVAEWPSFFALVTSFATILIMWVNHHNMFNHIRRIDSPLLFFNGLLLLFVVLTPFTTSLVSSYSLSSSDQNARTASAVYSGTFLLLAVVWNTLWYYVSHNRRLLGDEESTETVKNITFWYIFGPTFYIIAFVLAFVSSILSIITVLLAAAYFTVNATIRGQRS